MLKNHSWVLKLLEVDIDYLIVVVVVDVPFLYQLYKYDQVVKAPVWSDSGAPHTTPLWSKGNLFKGEDNKTVRR